MSKITDRDLLSGIVALRHQLISREQLITSLQARSIDQDLTLDGYFIQQGVMQPEQCEKLLEYVNVNLASHNNSVEESLADESDLVASIKEQISSVSGASPHVTLDTPNLMETKDSAGSLIHKARQQGAFTTGTRFKILRHHARGGLGEVSVAEDQELRREVALKEIQADKSHHPELRTRFIREAEITGSLEHPGIVPIYGLGVHPDGRPFYAMRFIRGESFDKAIRRHHQTQTDQGSKANATAQNLSLRRLLKHFIDVCQAVDFAHSRGVLHRDLKPGNVMLGQYGETLVVDWGLAKLFQEQQLSSGGDDAMPGPVVSETDIKETLVVGQWTPGQMASNRNEDSDSLTRDGSTIGTLPYMSPEQAKGNLNLIGPSSDIFSLGAILFEILTNRPPYRGNYSEALAAAQSAIYPTPRSLSPGIHKGLEAVCLKAIAKEPVERYATPKTLAEDIEAYLADEPVAARKESAWEQAARLTKRHRSIFLAGMTTLFLIAVTSIVAAASINRAKNRESSAKFQALASKEFAETEAKRADENAKTAMVATQKAERNALIAEARYFLSANDIPNALERLTSIDKQSSEGGSNIQADVGVQLLFNDVLDKSRNQVEFLTVLPIIGKESLFWGNDQFVTWDTSSQILRHSNIEKGTETQFELDFLPKSVTTAGKYLVVGGRNEVAVIENIKSVIPDNRTENLQIKAAQEFKETIAIVCTSDNCISITKYDEAFVLLNVADLAARYECQLSEIPGDFAKKKNERYFVSNTGRYVIIHATPWTEPATLIDTINADVKQLDGGELRLSTTGTLVFDKDDDRNLICMFSPSRNGGLPDEINSYYITSQLSLEAKSYRSADSMTTKVIKHLRKNDRSCTLYGSQGFVALNLDKNEPMAPIAYHNLWPMHECDYVASSEDGKLFALTDQSQRMLFRFAGKSASSSLARTGDYNNTDAIDGTINIDSQGKALSVIHQPATVSEPAKLRQVPWISDSYWIPWRVDVADGDNYITILAQETDGSNAVSANYMRKRALVFDTRLGIDHPDSWKPIANIEIPELYGTHGFDNHCVKISPDGKMLYVRNRSRVLVIRVSNGAVEVDVTQPFDAVSPDGRYCVVQSRDKHYQVIDLQTLERGIEIRSSIIGGCFSHDNNQLSVALKGKVEDFDVRSGRLLRTVSSPCIPAACLKRSPYVVAFLPAKADAGNGKLLLLNREDFSVVATLAENHALQNSVAIIGNDEAIYHQVHRWAYKVTRMLDHEQLLAELNTPINKNQFVMVSGTSANEKLPAPLEPVRSVSKAGGNSLPSIADSKLPKIKAGDKNLDALLKQQVQIDGIVDKIELTFRQDAANIVLRCDSGEPILIWIDRIMYAKFLADGYSIETCLGKNVRAIGRFGKYGGFAKSFENFFQLSLESVADFGIQGDGEVLGLPPTKLNDLKTSVEPVNELLPSSIKAELQETSRFLTAGSGRELNIFAWNVESDEADPQVIAKRIARYQQFDIVCLSEVSPKDFLTFQAAKGADFESVGSVSGGSDRLQIIYNREKYDLLETMELTRYRDYELNSGNHRSPLAVRLRDRASDTQFIVMVNHLARGNAEFRTQQAIGLREWARDQSVGVINVGDFNLDYLIATDQGNEAFNEMLRDNVYQWVRPKTLVDTNWADDNNDGIDDYPNDILDFAFVAGPAKDWHPTSVIIVEPGDFPDDETTSDHRPIAIRLDLGS